jgi:hypothetical protein
MGAAGDLRAKIQMPLRSSKLKAQSSKEAQIDPAPIHSDPAMVLVIVRVFGRGVSIDQNPSTLRELTSASVVQSGDSIAMQPLELGPLTFL